MPTDGPVKLMALLALASFLSGCDSGQGYQSISGIVKFQGAPVEQGRIQFFTTGENPTPQGGAMIVKGEYRVPREHGLKPGKYLVRISSPESTGAAGADDMAPPPTRERIPSKYNTASELTVEVRAGERGEFNFDLESGEVP
ncbi:MAG: hypothetical protein AB7K24_01960 [Gemmataceae bacterium]